MEACLRHRINEYKIQFWLFISQFCLYFLAILSSYPAIFRRKVWIVTYKVAITFFIPWWKQLTNLQERYIDYVHLDYVKKVIYLIPFTILIARKKRRIMRKKSELQDINRIRKIFWVYILQFLMYFFRITRKTYEHKIVPLNTAVKKGNCNFSCQHPDFSHTIFSELQR